MCRRRRERVASFPIGEIRCIRRTNMYTHAYSHNAPRNLCTPMRQGFL